MYSFVIYTTNRGNSYIEPAEKAQLPKVSKRLFEFDAPFEVVNRKVKLPAVVDSVDDVAGIIKRLAEKKDTEASS